MESTCYLSHSSSVSRVLCLNCKILVRIKRKCLAQVSSEVMLVPILLLTTWGPHSDQCFYLISLKWAVSIRIGHFILAFSFVNFLSFHSVEVTEKNSSLIMSADIWIWGQGGVSLTSHWHQSLKWSGKTGAQHGQASDRVNATSKWVHPKAQAP